MNPHEYVQANAERFKAELKELLKIPSVSTQVEHQADCEHAADWIANHLRQIGFQTVEIIKTAWHPVVFGEWMGAGKDAPTVLIYCHYDVQPAAVEDGWDTHPFEPIERDGMIFARGALDSKSNVISQLKSAEALIASGRSPVNLKLMFEGDEESASENMTAFIQQYRHKLDCDVIAVCDGSMSDREQPDLPYGLRGVVCMELEVHGPKQDLHSGHYGGTVHNPIQALAETISQLHHPDGSIAVPGFYDDVPPLEDEERVELAKALPWIEQEWQAVAAAPQQWGESEYNLHERSGARPTLEINGIRGGFAADGFKTVLPSKALAKISCRLVPNQTSVNMYELIKKYIVQITPPTVQTELRLLEIGEPIVIDRKSKTIQAAVRAYTKVWGKRPYFVRAGGSIPVVIDLHRAIDAEIVLLSYGYKGGFAHGPNEHVYLDMWYKGISTTIHLFEEIGKGYTNE